MLFDSLVNFKQRPRSDATKRQRTMRVYRVNVQTQLFCRRSSQESSALNSQNTIHGIVVRSNRWWYGWAVTNEKEAAFDARTEINAMD